MSVITIIGAGMMGSAMSFPARDNGHEVRLVGIHNRENINEIQRSGYHPTLKRQLPDGVKAYHLEDLSTALEGADLIIGGVSSFGVDWFEENILPILPANIPVLSVTKGLEKTPEGDLIPFPTAMTQRAEAKGLQVCLNAVGGPVTSYELADRQQTHICFCGKDLSVLKMLKKTFETDYYHISLTTDVTGLECAVAMKNAYALGVSLDSVMNYPLRTALLDFIHGRTDAYALRNFLISQQMNYPRPMYYSLMNLLGSHDVDRLRNALATPVDIRSLSREAQLRLEFSEEMLNNAIKREKLCAAVQFSLPGVPSIYYGDEQGMCGVNDPFNRLPFRAEDNGLHEYYVNLSALRNSSDALSVGEAEFSAPCADVLVILRYTEGGDAFLTVVNRSGKAHDYEVNCANAGRGIVKGQIYAETAEIIRL